MSTINFAIATSSDIPALDKLVNGAYRGEGAKKGWTTEADILGGIRTNEEGLQKMIDTPNASILKFTGEDGQLQGCVYLEQKNAKLYLGMLTVNPELQAQGIGKKLLKAAEDFGSQKNCTAITMTVISIRSELIAWYERHGYQKTGETQPFPTDPSFGLPKQALEFVVMEKEL